MSYVDAFEAALRGWEGDLVALHPHFAGVDLVDCFQLTIVCWIGGHVMTKGQLLPQWLRRLVGMSRSRSRT